MKKSELRQIIREELQRLNEAKVDAPPDALGLFNKELETHPDVLKLTKYYGKSSTDIIKALERRISVKNYNDKSVKNIKLAFTDTDSGIKVSHMKKFAKGVQKF